jgi:hypothetical protein
MTQKRITKKNSVCSGCLAYFCRLFVLQTTDNLPQPPDNGSLVSTGARRSRRFNVKRQAGHGFYASYEIIRCLKDG